MSHSIYQITPTKSSFIFVTDSGYTYEVYFDHETIIFPNDRIDRHAVFLGFSCSPHLKVFERSYDPKVGQTIMFIIEVFFKENPHAILAYVCSPNGGQELHRQVVFTRWYKHSHFQEKYKLLKQNFNGTYCGILYSFKHPSIKQIEGDFMSFEANAKPGVFEKEAYYSLTEEEIGLLLEYTSLSPNFGK